MLDILASITAVSAVSIVVAFALLLVLCLTLLSNWVMKPLNLSTKETGHKGFDAAQKQFEALDLELGIMEDLDGNPSTLNELSDKLAIAKTARDIEQENLRYQQALEDSTEAAENAVAVPDIQRLTNQ